MQAITMSDMLLFRVSELVIPLYIIDCPNNFKGCFKYDMGTLSWLNAKTVGRVPTPLFGRFVMCSAGDYGIIMLSRQKNGNWSLVAI